MLSPGDTLSDFTLEGVDENGEINTFTLSELTDDAVAVLNVYVYDYSPVCTEQVCDISELQWIDLRDDVTVAGISGDGPYSHQRFSEEYGISYPLLCDTSEEVIEELGVLHEEKDGLRRVPQRSIFLIDSDHRIRWQWIAEDNWDDWTSDPITSLQETINEIQNSRAENEDPNSVCPKCGMGFTRTDAGGRAGYELLGKGELLSLIRCEECRIEFAVPESQNVSLDLNKERPHTSFTIDMDV